MSSFGDVGSMRPQQIWNGVVGRTVHGDHVSFALVELDAGAEVPEHAHVNEQVGILLRGSMRFTIGGETRDLEPGATWRILADVPHSVLVGPDGAVAVEVFAPTREDWKALADAEPRPGPWPW